MRVSAGLCFQGEKIWIFKRGPGRKNAHLWEFPGGKEESGETPADCLVRELREELSLEVSPPQIVREADCEGIHFTFLRCEALNAPRCTEHEDCTLAEPRELLQYAFCPADTPVAQALALNGYLSRHGGVLRSGGGTGRHCGGTGTGADADEGQPRRVCASLRGGG